MKKLDQLTPREIEVITLVAHGMSNKEMACHLCITVHTIEQHLKHIYRKLELKNRTEASMLFWQSCLDHQELRNSVIGK